MEKKCIIILGRSGGGKGTQAALLRDKLERGGYNPVHHITTGDGFRAFIKSDSHVASVARYVNDTGGLQPEFLAVWNWTNILINTLTGEDTLILDGLARRSAEAHMLHGAIGYLGYKNPTVIYLDVSERVSRDHLVSRGREDDKDESNITNKMTWFEMEVLPTLEIYKADPRYTILHINGNQSIEEVHKDIIEGLGLGK